MFSGIVEVGGKLLWDEVRPWLNQAAKTLPFPAMAVSAEMLTKFREEEARLVATNENPISFEYLVRYEILLVPSLRSISWSASFRFKYYFLASLCFNF